MCTSTKALSIKQRKFALEQKLYMRTQEEDELIRFTLE